MSEKKSAPLIASLMAFGWIFFFFHDVVIHPNAHLFNEQGDGIKAFFVYADHIKNDKSYHQQSSMNYPYGQTYVFTDGQPVIANTVKLLTQFMPFLQNRSIAVYNYLILGSFVLCAYFIALILLRLNLPPSFATIGAFCITALSPQILRISGHPTMSYACFFPMAWYCLLRLTDSGFRLKWMAITVVNTTFWFFVHPYLGMVITFFYGFYFLVFAVSRSRKKLLNTMNIISALMLIAFPVLIVKIYTAHYDIHLFRSEFPWGFWNFYTSPEQVFFPHSGPFAPVFEYFFNPGSAGWDLEKMFYVGLATDIILIFFIFRMLRNGFHRKYFKSFRPTDNHVLNISMGAALLALLFSMCIPFKWGLQSMVEHIGFLRQFRALGRFAWAFYYVATAAGVYGFYLVFRYFRIHRLNVLAWTFAVFFFSMFAVEAYPDFREKSLWAIKADNYFNENLLPEEYKTVIDEVNKQKDKHQCLVTLPFFHVGTENFGVDFGIENIKASCIVSYMTNLPLMASSAARSPIIEGKNIMQFFSPGFLKKDIQNDLRSKKDFLILYTKEKLNAQETEMLRKSTKIFDNGKFELWSLPYNEAFRNNSSEYFERYSELKDSLFEKRNFKVTSLSDTIDYKNYDSLKSELSYKGKGALKAKKRDFTLLFKAEGKIRSDIDYTVSFWYYNKGELRNQVLCIVEESQKDWTNSRWEIIWDPRTSMVIDGDWTLVEKKFRIRDGMENIKIFVQGDLLSKQEIYIDEFLLRPSHVDVFAELTTEKDSCLFYNNLWIKKNKD